MGPVCVKAIRTQELRRLGGAKEVCGLSSHRRHTKYVSCQSLCHVLEESKRNPHPNDRQFLQDSEPRPWRCANEMDEVGFPTFSTAQS